MPQALVKRGYKAIKLHTWMPSGARSPDPKLDVKACAAVREAVGPDIVLMLDAYHWYSRTDALYLGRELQKLDYAWYEEPMEEASMSSYVWLAQNLDIPILGPEVVAGKHYARAEWAKSGACDIMRTGVFDVGGITPSMKVAHLAEAFNMNCEIHGGGVGNLTVRLLHQELRLVRARPAPSLPRLRQAARLSARPPRPDGRRRLRAHLADNRASAPTSTSNTSTPIWCAITQLPVVIAGLDPAIHSVTTVSCPKLRNGCPSEARA